MPKKGGLGQFADLRGGAWQERGGGTDTLTQTMNMRFHYHISSLVYASLAIITYSSAKYTIRKLRNSSGLKWCTV